MNEKIRQVKHLKRDSKLSVADAKKIAQKVYKKRTYHVLRREDGNWSVQKQGAQRAVKLFERKKDAVEYARRLSKSTNLDLVVHRKDGSIEHSARHGV